MHRFIIHRNIIHVCPLLAFKAYSMSRKVSYNIIAVAVIVLQTSQLNPAKKKNLKTFCSIYLHHMFSLNPTYDIYSAARSCQFVFTLVLVFMKSSVT